MRCIQWTVQHSPSRLWVLIVVHANDVRKLNFYSANSSSRNTPQRMISTFTRSRILHPCVVSVSVTQRVKLNSVQNTRDYSASYASARSVARSVARRADVSTGQRPLTTHAHTERNQWRRITHSATSTTSSQSLDHTHTALLATCLSYISRARAH